jgi:hypothetical protein
MRCLFLSMCAILAIAFTASSPANAGAIASVFGTGANQAGLQATVDAFRTLIGGGFVAGPNGSFGGIRREINWDGVPDSLSAPNNLPANFFNVNSPRGVVFSTPGTGFQVSGNAGVAPVRFDNINATYSSIFQTFSPQRLFTTFGSDITDVFFFLPGTNIASSTRFFGAVFTDIDNATANLGCTSIEPFNGAVSLGSFCAPALSNGLSFLGLQATGSDVITRVRVTSGNVALGINDSPPTGDVVVMDDFIFQEVGIPEPSTVILAAIGLMALYGASRYKRASRNDG